jgi:hypothetical protein
VDVGTDDVVELAWAYTHTNLGTQKKSTNNKEKKEIQEREESVN